MVTSVLLSRLWSKWRLLPRHSVEQVLSETVSEYGPGLEDKGKGKGQGKGKAKGQDKGKGKGKGNEKVKYVQVIKFKSATEIVCELDRAIPISRKLQIYPSINGGYQPLTKTFDVTIFALAPKVRSCTFNSDGAAVLVTFDTAINTAGLKDTSDLLTKPTLFGTKPRRLQWTTQKNLKITVGKGSASELVKVGSTLTFKNGVIKPLGQEFSKAFTQTLTVKVSNNPVEPTAVLTGSFAGAKCDTLKFSGRQSFGAAGRSWKDSKIELSCGGAKALKQPTPVAGKKMQWTLAGEDVTGSCEVKLTVTNFLDQSGTVTKKLDIKTGPVPQVSISCNKDAKNLKRSTRARVCAKAKLPGGTCQTGDKKVTFTWSFQGGSPTVDPNQVNSRCYVIKPYKLKVGSYKLLAKVELEGAADSVTVSLDITLKGQDLIAIISDAPSKLGADSPEAVLSGIQSQDPDKDEAVAMTHEWGCETSDGQCTDKDGNALKHVTSVTYTFNPKQMVVDTEYTITLKVSKGARSKSTSVKIQVVAGKPPIIQFNAPQKAKDASRRIRINAFVKPSAGITKTEWKSVDKSVPDGGTSYAVVAVNPIWAKSVILPDKRMEILKIPKNTLAPGATYLFSLQADTASASSTGYVKLKTASIVTNCELTVDPAPYKVVEDITLSVSGCVAAADQYPLTYRFKILRSVGYVALAVGGDSPSITVPGPEASDKGKATFLVKVCDNGGNCFKFTKSDVGVTESTMTVDELKKKRKSEFLRLTREKRFGDALASMNIFNKLIKQLEKKTSGKKRRKRSVTKTAEGEELTITTLEALLATKDTLSANLITTTCGSLGSVDINQMIPDDQKKFGQLLGDLLVEGAKHGIGTTCATVAMKQAEALMGAKAITGEEMAKIQSNVNAALFKGGNGQDGPAVVKSPNSVMTIVTYEFDGILVGKDATNPVKVSFPTEMKTKYTNWACDGVANQKCNDIGVAITHFNAKDYKRSTITEADQKEKLTNVVSVNCNNPKTGEQLKIEKLTEPVEIHLPLSTGKSCTDVGTSVCKYEDPTSKSWKTEGVTSGGCDDKTKHIICKSKHLSTFMAVNVPTTTTTAAPTTSTGVSGQASTSTPVPGGGVSDRTGAIIGGVVGGILAALLVGMFIFFICRIQQRDVMKVDHIEMGKPTLYSYENTQFDGGNDPGAVSFQPAQQGESKSQTVHM